MTESAKSETASSADAPDLERGGIFAERYEIVRLLGEGGMGRVYLARDTRSGGREIALKLLRRRSARLDLASGEDGMTFVSLGSESAEARFLASCEHPSILPVYDSGADPATGLAYYTMRACLLSCDEMRRLCDDVIGCPYPRDKERWAEGPSALTLRNLLKGDKALPEAAVARMGVDIVEALAYTHARTPPLIHRDIKPSNILIDATGRAILADFGIAKEMFTGSGAAATSRHVFAGTPAYSAPEQRSGMDATAASDYYSLGVVLHEALTGERLVGSAAPSGFDAVHISRKWDPLLARMLAADPGERLADPEEILRQLRSILCGGAARRRRRILLWISAAVAVAAGIAAIVAVSGFREPAPESMTPYPETLAARAADVRQKVDRVVTGPEWPETPAPWFPEILFAPRPENNRRHFEGAAFEMLLPDGTPMQFTSMAFELDRLFDYAHGYFTDADGRPNMSQEEKEASRTVVSKRLLFSRTEVTREQFNAVMSATNAISLRAMTISDWTNAPAAMARTGMGPKEFGSRLRYIQGRAAAEGKTLSDYIYHSIFLRIPMNTPPQSGLPAAEGVRFADVERFVAKLNSLCPPGCTFRLPTEAEWEAACRINDNRRFEGEEPDEVCWSRENSGGTPHPVAQKKPNFLGIFDLHGNVAEWCLDGYAPLVRPAFDPIAPVPANGMHVVRGGSWADSASECGSEVRRGAGPKATGIGIRLVLEY